MRSPVSWGPWRIDVFWREADDALWHRWFEGGWRGPESLGSGPLDSEPHPVSWGPGHIDIFWRGTDHALWHRRYEGSTGWHGPESLGAAPLGSDPHPVSWGSGRIDVFWRGTDHALWHRWYEDGTGWHGPESLGSGPLNSEPHPVSWGPGHLEIFWRGTDHALWHRRYEGSTGWHGPESLGAAPLGSDPHPVSWGPGHIDVFWRGTDEALWHRWYQGGATNQWFGPESLHSAPLRSDPQPFSWGEGRIDVLWRGPGDELIHRWYQGGASNQWFGPESLGSGPLGSDPRSVNWGPGRFDVFWQGTDHALWHGWYESAGPSWFGPESLGAAPLSSTIVSTIPNVCLAREASNPKVYLVCGETKLWISDPADFATLGFRWDKVRTVADGALARFVEKPLAPPAAKKPSDVFFAPRSDCKSKRDYSPFHWGNWIPNLQAVDSVMSQNVLVAGWLIHDPVKNVVAWGLEDVYYNVALDPDFVTPMYGPGGLSTLLVGKAYHGNLGEEPGTIDLPVEDRSEVDGTSRGVTFNSFVLTGGGDSTHGELTAWHIADTSGDSGDRIFPDFVWPNHFVGRGAPPAGWAEVKMESSATPPHQTVPIHVSDSAWFPWNIDAPSGERLREGDYVLMRGPIWQDVTHGGEGKPEFDWWHPGATAGHEGWVEMHPVDWVVRLRPRPPGLRKSGRSLVQATDPGQGQEQQEENSRTVSLENAVWVDPDVGFSPSGPTRVLSVRDVEEIVDGRCSDIGTVIPHSRATDFGGSRWKSYSDYVELRVKVKGTPNRQGRFKAAYIVSWRETDKRDQVWVDDALPAGAQPGGDEPWAWVSDKPRPFFGTQSHQSSATAGQHQHFFTGATTQLVVGTYDILFTMVYLDPDRPPAEVMLQWNDGSWEHRAYWGDNLIGWGVDGTPGRRSMGPLPESGAWVRLEVPASAVGLDGRTLNGMAFTLWNGRATWDYAGKMTVPPPPPPLAMDAAFVSQTVPASILADNAMEVSITMRNSGTSAWTQADAVRLVCTAPTWSVTPVELPVATVAPGQTATFAFSALAPSTAGTKSFHCRMQRGPTLFGETTPSKQVIVLADV